MTKQDVSHKEALKEILTGQKLTFRGAKRRHSVGQDLYIIATIAAEYAREHADVTKRLAMTLACAAFWELAEERKGI